MEPEGSLQHAQEPATCLLPCAKSIKFTSSQPISLRSILLLSPHLRLGLPSGLCPSGSPTEVPCAPLLSPVRATCSTHLILNGLITRIVFSEQYKSRSPSFHTCLPSSCFVARRPKYLPQHHICNTQLVFFPQWGANTRQNYSSVCFYPRVNKYQVEDRRIFAANKFVKLLSGYHDPCHCRVWDQLCPRREATVAWLRHTGFRCSFAVYLSLRFRTLRVTLTCLFWVQQNAFSCLGIVTGPLSVRYWSRGPSPSTSKRSLNSPKRHWLWGLRSFLFIG
jgi:hypothetical protein